MKKVVIKGLIAELEFDMIGDNKDLIKEYEVLGKKILNLNAATDKELAKAYCLLDGNAFDDQPAPIWHKMDSCVMGGCPVVMFLPTKYALAEVVEQLETKNMEYTPIGFLDLHPLKDNKVAASGLGIAKLYQNKGLSKYLIYAGIKLSGATSIKVPTQLSNKIAHKAWEHLGNLNVLYQTIYHNMKDSIVYEIDVPSLPEIILGVEK